MTDPLLDGLEARVQAALAPTMPPPPVAPGLCVTVGNVAPVQDVITEALPLLASIRPDVVILHTYPEPRDVVACQAVLRALPGVRLWIQAPANVLAGGDERRAIRRAETWAAEARDLGAEVLSLNGEMASRPGSAGWDAATPAEAAAEAQRIARILAAMAAVPSAPGLAWCSHDRSGRLPLAIWHAVLGAGSPVLLHIPQVYAAPVRGIASRAEALARLDAHRRSLALAGIRPELAPGGTGWAPYVQAHHHALSAACALYDSAPLACAWTLPERCDDLGVLALRADAELRRLAGHAPGRAARYQAAHGLTADGIVGPATLRALGLA